MTLKPSIFKAYDIRGLYPQELNEENAEAVFKAIYTFFKKDLQKEHLSVVLGHDMRVSSPALREVARKSLVSLGAQVIDIGLVSTPTVYYAVKKFGYDAGIQISASHNPKEYNGIKFLKKVGDKLVKIGKTTGMDDVKQIAIDGAFAPEMSGGSVTEKSDVLTQEVADALSIVAPKAIKDFTVVADAANAMGALYIEELFKHIPAKLVTMNFNLDGTFPSHQADPLQFKLLADLQKKVVEEKADLGIAPDGDGDRVFFIDEKGEIIPATMISSLIAREILQKEPHEKILVDVRYTRNVVNICKKLGGTPLLSKVGHALITEQVNKEDAAFAGESSGHFYFREMGGCESAVRVVLYVLDAMGRENKPISEIVKELHSSYESGEYNFELPEGVAAKGVLDEIAAKYPGEISWLDGISIDFPEWRVNIRTSNTEPLMRLNVEGETREVVQSKLKELSDFIVSKGAVPKE